MEGGTAVVVVVVGSGGRMMGVCCGLGTGRDEDEDEDEALCRWVPVTLCGLYVMEVGV